MDENEFEIYCEWAETELLWGKGCYNWRRNWSDYQPEEKDKKDDDIEIPF